VADWAGLGRWSRVDHYGVVGKTVDTRVVELWGREGRGGWWRHDYCRYGVAAGRLGERRGRG
jgi:hypothetical protein